MDSNMVIFSGSSHPVFAQALAAGLKLPLGKAELTVFPNSERRVWIQDAVANEDVVVVQSFSAPADEHIVEFALMCDAFERAGAKSITAVVPWMGYSLQDKVFRQGEPIAARVVANILSMQHLRRVMLMDLHSSSVEGFFSIPTTVLSSVAVFVEDVRARYAKEDVVVVAPDIGGLKRARTFAEQLEKPLVHIDKSRDLATGKVTAKLVGDGVEGKTCLVFDDSINTGSTLVEIAKVLKEHGAKKVVCYATHALLAGNAVAALEGSQVDEVVVGDTVSTNTKKMKKLRVVSVLGVFTEALRQLI